LERQWFDILRDAERLEVRLEPKFAVHSDEELWHLVQFAIAHRRDPLHLLHDVLERHEQVDLPTCAAERKHPPVPDSARLSQQNERLPGASAGTPSSVSREAQGWASRLLAQDRPNQRV
jgi:hypothetical protein